MNNVMNSLSNDQGMMDFESGFLFLIGFHVLDCIS